MLEVWHVGAPPSPNAVDGVGMVVWQVAREQANLGHAVTLILDAEPDESARTLAAEANIRLIHLTSRFLRYDGARLRRLLRESRPDIVHFHKTFIPEHFPLTRTLISSEIPYVLTPHGGVNHRKRNLKKTAYTWLVERGRFRRAAAITTVAPLEERAIRKLVTDYKREITWIPNPVDVRLLDGHEWSGDLYSTPKKMMFLGRFHVVNKGIDTLVQVSHRLLGEVEAHLYGTDHPQTGKLLARLKADLPRNVHFHGPVSGEEKARLLAGSDLYIQTSRWEGFSISIAEAMYVGVPCVVTDTPHPDQIVHHAEVMKDLGLGLVLPVGSEQAAKVLLENLSEPSRLLQFAARARSFARENFTPRAAALGYLEVYGKAMSEVPASSR
ncbi:MAG: glycosyltransferase family 4 protein [Rubrobacter sp.]